MSLWWLSFIDPGKPVGQKFLGVSIVNDTGDGVMSSAVYNAYRLGCNPGGEVQGIIVPDDLVAKVVAYWRNRLLTKNEAHSS